MITFGSLFTGIGGFDLGFERAGLQCQWQVERDEFALRVLQRYWPDVPKLREVKTVGKHNLSPVDVICGGDPCQRDSAAGRSHAENLSHEFLRIVGELRPRIVVRENPARVRRDAICPWYRFRSGLVSIGYSVLPFRLRACCLGAIHRRDRLFLLGVDSNADRNRLEGRARPGQHIPTIQPPRLVETRDWLAIYSSRGLDSRAGVPGYVDQVRGLGNAVVPQVSEWIGRMIVRYF